MAGRTVRLHPEAERDLKEGLQDSIVYRAAGDEIHIFAVAHAKRRPVYWGQRRMR